MLNAEIDVHISYYKNSPESKDTSNRRNSHGEKIQSTFRDTAIKVPIDKESCFKTVVS